MENNVEKKMEQKEKQAELKDEILEKVNGGGIVQKEDGSYYCNRCRKTVSENHKCPGTGIKVLVR